MFSCHYCSSDVKLEDSGVNVEPVGIAEEDEAPAGVVEEDDTPANVLFKLALTLTVVYVDISKGSRNSPRFQNFLANAMVT